MIDEINKILDEQEFEVNERPLNRKATVKKLMNLYNYKKYNKKSKIIEKDKK